MERATSPKDEGPRKSPRAAKLSKKKDERVTLDPKKNVEANDKGDKRIHVSEKLNPIDVVTDMQEPNQQQQLDSIEKNRVGKSELGTTEKESKKDKSQGKKITKQLSPVKKPEVQDIKSTSKKTQDPKVSKSKGKPQQKEAEHDESIKTQNVQSKKITRSTAKQPSKARSKAKNLKRDKSPDSDGLKNEQPKQIEKSAKKSKLKKPDTSKKQSERQKTE